MQTQPEDIPFPLPPGSLYGHRYRMLGSILLGAFAAFSLLPSLLEFPGELLDWLIAVVFGIQAAFLAIEARWRRGTPIITVTSDDILIRKWSFLHPHRVPFRLIMAVDKTSASQVILTTRDGDAAVVQADWFVFDEYPRFLKLVEDRTTVPN